MIEKGSAADLEHRLSQTKAAYRTGLDGLRGARAGERATGAGDSGTEGA